MLLVGFKSQPLKHLTGKTLAEVAAKRGNSPEETAMDLVIEDDSRVDTVYFMMDEDDVKKNIALPWVSFGSDASSPANEGPFLLSQPHPRTYGNFARLLGKYVRDEKVIPLEEAIRKLSGLPAENLGLTDRGLLQARLPGRRRRLRPRKDPGPRHLRAAAPVLHRRAARVRQRQASPRRRRAHRRQAGPGGVGEGAEEEVAAREDDGENDPQSMMSPLSSHSK